MIRYAITDSTYTSNDAARWHNLGVDFVQLREKSMDVGALAILARKILADLSPHTRLLINSRADVAIATGAAGVHLTAHPNELTPQQLRDIFASANAGTPVISISCHTLAEVERAHTAGVDHILFGPVFEKRIANELITAGTGLKLLQRAREIAAPTKVLALGGVTPSNIPQCINAGAAGVAGIRLFNAPSPPE